MNVRDKALAARLTCYDFSPFITYKLQTQFHVNLEGMIKKAIYKTHQYFFLITYQFKSKSYLDELFLSIKKGYCIYISFKQMT